MQLQLQRCGIFSSLGAVAKNIVSISVRAAQDRETQRAASMYGCSEARHASLFQLSFRVAQVGLLGLTGPLIHPSLGPNMEL